MVKILFILLVCYMPIIGKYLPATNFGAGIPDLGPVRLTSYLLIFVFAMESAVIKQTKIFYKWIGFIIVYTIVVLASVSWSNYSYSFSVINRIFDTVIVPLIIAIIALNLFSKSEDNIDTYIKNIIIASFILSLMGVLQMLLGGPQNAGNVGLFATSGADQRSTATFANPNTLAIFLVLTIPCLIYAMEKQLVPTIFGKIISASIVGGIICTISRKGAATAILAFCLYYFLKGRFKKIVVTGFVVLVLASILSGYVFISQRFSEDKLDKHFAGKWVMTVAGFEMYKESPLIGLGYNGYFENFGRYFPWSIKDKYDAHNIFITALANFGLLGFIPFLGILLYPLFYSKKIIRENRIANNAENCCNMAIICISSVIPFMVNGWFAGGLINRFSVIILLYSNIALVFASDQHGYSAEEG